MAGDHAYGIPPIDSGSVPAYGRGMANCPATRTTFRSVGCALGLLPGPLSAAAPAQVAGQTAAEPPPSRIQPAPDPPLPVYLRDRGTGVSTSMFGTYVRRRELLVYPFFEYYLDNDTRMRTGRSPSPKSSSRAIKTSP